MRNILTAIKLVAICILFGQLIACDSKNNDIVEKNSFKINGIEYTASGASYYTKPETVSLYFGNPLDNSKEDLAKQIEIVINTTQLSEGHFYYPHNTESELIISTIYSYKENGELKTAEKLTKGEISLISIDKFYFVDYNLTITDGEKSFTIEGHFVGEIICINC